MKGGKNPSDDFLLSLGDRMVEELKKKSNGSSELGIRLSKVSEEIGYEFLAHTNRAAKMHPDIGVIRKNDGRSDRIRLKEA